MAFELSHSWTMASAPQAPRIKSPIPSPEANAIAYTERARSIERRHDAQTLADVMSLRRKYAAPVFGAVKPWSLVEKLAQCIDPSDQSLLCASQQLHVLQIIDAMESEGTATDEWLLVALVHDLGKVLLLTDELPENVVGMNRPITVGEPGGGLHNCVLQWNHDEFAYSRLKDYLPDHVAWMVRYHSVIPERCDAYMDARDRDYAQRYLAPFARYDHFTKSPLRLPQRRLEDYRYILDRALPATIEF